MVTTGIKQVIVNNPSQISYDTTAKVLSVVGVGKYDVAQMRKCALMDTKAAVPGQYKLTFTGASLNYAVGDLLSIGLLFSTYRDQGEYESAFKQGADPLVLQRAATTAVSTTALAVDVAAAITAMSVEEKARYKIASASAAAGVVTVVMTEWYAIVRRAEVNGVSGVFIDRVKATNHVLGAEGRGLPQFMEESVKSDTMANRSAYGLENDMQLDMNTTYLQLNMEFGYTTLENTNTAVLNGGPTARIAKAQIWLDSAAFTDAELATLKIVHGTPATTGYFIGDLNAINALSANEEAYGIAAVANFQDVV